MSLPGYCACGEPLHYSDVAIQASVEDMIARLGECVLVTVHDGRSWMVPRHYIALHGLWEASLPDVAAQYGFKEVKGDG